jgi:hypothetical protein
VCWIACALDAGIQDLVLLGVLQDGNSAGAMSALMVLQPWGSTGGFVRSGFPCEMLEDVGPPRAMRILIILMALSLNWLNAAAGDACFRQAVFCHCAKRLLGEVLNVESPSRPMRIIRADDHV